METKNIRRTNLKRLLDALELSQAAFAERCGLAPSVISQLVNGYRNLGDSLARRIEDSLAMPKGWFDVPHETEGIEGLDSEPLPLTTQEGRVLELFRQLPDSEKGRLINQLEEKVKDFDRLFEELIKIRGNNLMPK